MMLLDVQQENTTATPPLIVTPKDDAKEASTFSDLLQKMKLPQEEKEEFELLLKSDEIKDNQKSSSKDKLLQSLLSGDEIVEFEEEFVELNPKLATTLSKDELKSLIAESKEYLKRQILQSDGFKESEIELLPKTLKGLTQVAKKIGIDISKITLQEVQVEQTESKSSQKNSFIQDLQSSKEEGIDDRLLKQERSELKNRPLTKLQKEHSPIEGIDEKDFKDTFKNEQKSLLKEKKQTQLKSTTPLFKAQTTTEITTEQLVNSKISNTKQELKSPKERSNETLQLLLRGEKAAKSESGLTADFSVATAKVIAPREVKDSALSLERLLGGNTLDSQTATESKVDTINTPKADSFEVKLNEAKQMIKYLSNDVKEAINNYKAPFTRVKVQLNPQQLGEVELTVVQRGKNLHVNLSSNNAAINTLAMNANELKVQLQNSGINNASLNFSNNSQGGDAAGGGGSHSQQQNRQEAHSEYNYFENDETHEEILSSLEIVVPNYA